MSKRHMIIACARPRERPHLSPLIKTIIVGTPGALTGNFICYDSQQRFYRDSSDFNALQKRLLELPLYEIGSHGQLQFRPKNGNGNAR